MLEVLGEVRLRGPAGVIPIRSRHQRTLLAMLALGRGRLITADRLVEALWGEALPADPSGSLQSHVSRLRRLLPPSVTIETDPNGYRLVADTDAVDAWAFDAAWAGGEAGPAAERLAAFDRALATWRGPPYGELEDDDARAEATRLGEVRVAMLGSRAEALIELGRVSQAVADLEHLRVLMPFRDEVAGLGMRALVAAGRTADALQVYREHRERLAGELGIEPGPALRELEGAILREEVAGPVPPPVARRAAIPEPASSLQGRVAELAALVELVRQQRVVTLVGPGGVGKTRLALEVARRVQDDFDDGAALIELATVADADAVVELAATRLGVTPQADGDLTERIADVLRRRSLLVVLDNAEHVIDHAARLVETIARLAPRVHLVTTSRERLGVEGEHCRPVSPLGLDRVGDTGPSPAVELFAARAIAVRPDFVLDAATEPAVADICHRLDGLPLAIELAAARLVSLSLEEIAAGLDRPFALLDRGRRTAAPRHRSLREVVEWSVRELTAEQRAVFIDLSVFASSFRAADAAAVCRGRSPDTADLIADLVERSLLSAAPGSEAPGAGRERRFRYLETIRTFARDLLDDSHAAPEVLDRHASWALEGAEAAASWLVDEREAAADARLVGLLPELRAAHRHLLERRDEDRALRLSAALHPWAWPRMQFEVLAWADTTMQRFAHSAHPLASVVLASAAAGAWQRGDLGAARVLVERGEAVAAAHDDAAARGARESAGDLALLEGRLDEAAAAYAEAVAMSVAAHDWHRYVINLGNLVLAHGYAGHRETARDHATRARAALTHHPAPTLHAWVDFCEGEVLVVTDPERALALLERSVAVARGIGARFVAGVAGLTWLTTRARTGDSRSDLDALAELLHEWHQAGLWTQQWTALRSVIDLLARMGDARGAARLLGAMDRSSRTTPPYGDDAARLEARRAALRMVLGDEFDAELAAGRSLDDDGAVALALDCLREPTSG